MMCVYNYDISHVYIALIFRAISFRAIMIPKHNLNGVYGKINDDMYILV